MSELKLSASEALYGFVGWLTTRKEPTVLSSATVIDRAPALIEAFCRENDLEPPRDRWPVLLRHPVPVEEAKASAMNEVSRPTYPLDVAVRRHIELLKIRRRAAIGGERIDDDIHVLEQALEGRDALAEPSAMNEAMKEVDRVIDGEQCPQGETQAADPLAELKHRLLQAAIFFAGRRHSQALAFTDLYIRLCGGPFGRPYGLEQGNGLE